jgi:exonuclease I
MTLEDKLNEKSFNLEIFKNDLVKLGENKDYIEGLVIGYAEMYFKEENDVLDINKYQGFYNDFTEHLLDIVKMKYPLNYEILKKEFGAF